MKKGLCLISQTVLYHVINNIVKTEAEKTFVSVFFGIKEPRVFLGYKG